MIRGPGSSLYGNNAFFTVINVITRRGRDMLMRSIDFRNLPLQRKMLVLILLICGTVLVVASAALFAFLIEPV